GSSQSDADSRPRRRTHLHHGARRHCAPRLQHQSEREAAARRLRGADGADGDRHLQRSRPHQLDRPLHALEVSAPTGAPFANSSGGGSSVRRIKLPGTVVLALALVAGFGRASAAQTTVTSSDIQRLQDMIYDVSRDVNQLRSRDAALASQLQAELDDARDEAVYLRVKVRRNEPITRTEYDAVRNEIENIRSRARGDSSGGYTPPPAQSDRDYPRDTSRPAGTVGRTANPNEVPVGTEFDVRLEQPISSETARVEDR